VAEPERHVVAGRIGPQPRRRGGDRRGPAAETVIDEVLLHGRRADLVAAFREPIGVLARGTDVAGLVRQEHANERGG
jgi:hypothetical protein